MLRTSLRIPVRARARFLLLFRSSNAQDFIEETVSSPVNAAYMMAFLSSNAQDFIEDCQLG